MARSFFYLLGGRVIGAENIPRVGAVIIAPNHVSNVDPPFIQSVTPRDILHSIAKQELFRGRIMSWVMPRLGCIPVNREHVERAFLKSVKAVLENGGAILLFPEGTRSPDGKLQKGQPGVAIFAKMTNAQVVPCCIRGSVSGGPLMIRYGEPLLFRSGDTVDGFTTRLMEAITSLQTMQ